MLGSGFSKHPVAHSILQVIRLESQVKRYKAAAENSEKLEEELKLEKRKLQREVMVEIVLFNLVIHVLTLEAMLYHYNNQFYICDF